MAGNSETEREEFLIQTNIVQLLSVVNRLNYQSPHRKNEQSFFYFCLEKTSFQCNLCINQQESAPLAYTLESDNIYIESQT